MRTITRLLVVPAFVAASMFVATVPANAQAGDEAFDVVEQWGAAFNANDAAAVAALYAPDAVFWRTNATELTNGAGAFAYFDAFTNLDGRENWVGTWVDPMIYTVDDNNVVIGVISSLDFGNGAVSRYRMLFSVSKIGDTWMIVGHHSSPLVEPE